MKLAAVVLQLRTVTMAVFGFRWTRFADFLLDWTMDRVSCADMQLVFLLILSVMAFRLPFYSSLEWMGKILAMCIMRTIIYFITV
jgi:hypothetical protein